MAVLCLSRLLTGETKSWTQLPGRLLQRSLHPCTGWTLMSSNTLLIISRKLHSAPHMCDDVMSRFITHPGRILVTYFKFFMLDMKPVSKLLHLHANQLADTVCTVGHLGLCFVWLLGSGCYTARQHVAQLKLPICGFQGNAQGPVQTHPD